MATKTLAAGAKIPGLDPGDTLILDGKGYTNLHFDGLEGTALAPIIIQSAAPLSAKITGGEFGLRAENCVHVAFHDLDITADGHGCKPTDSAFLIFRGCLFHDCGVEGIILGGVTDTLLEDCEARGNGRGYAEYPAEKGHGAYVSWNSKRVTIRRLFSRNNGGCGVQWNGTPEISGVLEGCVIEDSRLLHNGFGGAAGMNVMRTKGLRASNVLLAWWQWTEQQDEAGGIACYSDGSDLAVEDSVFEKITVYFPPGRGRYGMQFIDGSRSNQVKASLVYCGRGLALQGDVDHHDGSVFAVSGEATANLVSPTTGDFTSRKPGYGWTSAMPVNPPPPVNPSPTPDLPAARAALQDAAAALEKAEEGNDAMASLIPNVARRALKKSLAETNAGEALNLRDAKSAVARARKAVGE